LLAEPKSREIFLDSVIYDPSAPTTAAEQITQSTCRADAVVAGTVLDLQPFLNEDASFILTEYTVRVEESLRGPRVEPGSTMSYVRAGGTMTLGGAPVTATHNLYPPLLQGQKYVLF